MNITIKEEIKSLKNEEMESIMLPADSSVIEYFWIKTETHHGSPFIVNDGRYLCVWMYADKVVIWGQDNERYCKIFGETECVDDFVKILKNNSIIWNFEFPESIFPGLKLDTQFKNNYF